MIGHWVDINQEKPKEGELVLIHDAKEGILLATFEGSYWSERATGCGCCGSSLKPTHWMQAPLPPH